jgi:hypothetical protein
MPAAPTLRATRQFETKRLMLTSNPTKKRNRTRPRFATSDKLGIAAVGKIAAWKPGFAS